MNNSIEISIADNIEVHECVAWVGREPIDAIIGKAYGVEEDDPSKKFFGRLTIKIEDLTEPMRVTRPEEPSEEA